jgi:hypothetical protein
LTRDVTLVDLQRFLFEHVASYEELDVLLLLVRGWERSWSPQSVAKALSSTTDDCRLALADLATSGLLAVDEASGSYRYAPATDEVARDVETLERTYREQRAAVAMMMSTNAVERVRTSALSTFGEAFRVREPKK